MTKYQPTCDYRFCSACKKLSLARQAAALRGYQQEPHGLSDVGVASNPDVLLAGNAPQAVRKPREVVVGADCPDVLRVLRRFYKSFVDLTTRLLSEV